MSLLRSFDRLYNCFIFCGQLWKEKNLNLGLECLLPWMLDLDAFSKFVNGWDRTVSGWIRIRLSFKHYFSYDCIAIWRLPSTKILHYNSGSIYFWSPLRNSGVLSLVKLVHNSGFFSFHSFFNNPRLYYKICQRIASLPTQRQP